MADTLSTELWTDLLRGRLSPAACLSAGYHILDLLVDACPGIEFRTGAGNFSPRRYPSSAVLGAPAQNSWLLPRFEDGNFSRARC